MKEDIYLRRFEHNLKNKEIRQLKIEKYKKKRRNWFRRISYDCRKQVADSRLRIKGRFISKKDTQTIKEFLGDNNDAFNNKKNLNLDFINRKMTGSNINLAISKNDILYEIEKLLIQNRLLHTTNTMDLIINRIHNKQQIFSLF